MAYYQTFQPYPYQDQLNQLRTANSMPMQGFQPYPAQQMPMNRPDPNGLNWVQGEAGAKSWYITPGATVLLMDSENQRFYLKSADMNGVPAMRTFEYSEVGAQKPQEAPQAANFVTMESFNDFRNEVAKKLEELSNMEVSVSRKKKGDANE
jgi:hypothetical protein